MNQEIRDAQAELEAEGLTAEPSGEASLWICATTREVGAGIPLSNDAMVLHHEAGRWTAIFPATASASYEVTGDLKSLVLLIRDIYADYRRPGGALGDAFARTVPDPESHRVGLPATAGLAADAPSPHHVEVGGIARA